MRALMGKVRTRAGLAAVGGALLLTVGGTATAAVVTSNPATDEVSDVSNVTTEPTVESDPEAVVVETTPEAPAATTGAPAPAATVETVTEPAQTTPPEPVAETPQAYDPMAPFTDEAGQTYLPAPEVPAPKLPGEPGYVPPGG